MMHTSLKATRIDLTNDLRSYAEERAGAIERLLDERDTDARIDIELEKTTEHHQSGKIYRAVMTIVSGDTNLRAEAKEEDIRAALDEVRDELMEEVRRYKGKKTTLVRKGARMWKDMLHKMGRGEGEEI